MLFLADRLGELRRTAARNLAYGLGVVGLALIGIIPLSGRMTRNLTALTHGAEQLAQGDLQARVEIKSKDEFGRLAQAFNRMAAAGEEFGINRLEALVVAERLKGPAGILAAVEKEICDYRNNVEAADDATMLLVRIGPPQSTA